MIKRCEKEAFSRMEKMISSGSTDKEKIAGLLREIFVSPDSLATSVNPLDVEILLRKLPPEYRAINSFFTALLIRRI